MHCWTKSREQSILSTLSLVCLSYTWCTSPWSSIAMPGQKINILFIHNELYRVSQKRSYSQNAPEALKIITVLHRGGPANYYGVPWFWREYTRNFRLWLCTIPNLIEDNQIHCFPSVSDSKWMPVSVNSWWTSSAKKRRQSCCEAGQHIWISALPRVPLFHVERRHQLSITGMGALAARLPHHPLSCAYISM